jgi:hypothetical protein
MEAPSEAIPWLVQLSLKQCRLLLMKNWFRIQPNWALYYWKIYKKSNNILLLRKLEEKDYFVQLNSTEIKISLLQKNSVTN